MIISFAGHSLIPCGAKVKEIVKEKIKEYIANEHFVTFYLGGYGDFDEICAEACRELKKDFENIDLVYVTPYFDLSHQVRIKEMQMLKLYDSSIYPPIENTPLKYAISKRNDWMMKCADMIIAYVCHNSGGAYNSLKTAERYNKKIINIYDLI